MVREFFKIPEFCPVCGSTAEEEGSFLYCRSKSCPARLSGSVKVWIARLGILNWGDVLIDSLTNPDDPKIESIADLYRLSVEDIAMCSSGMKFAKKCYDSLHLNKSVKLELMLSALNITNFGLATATDVVSSGYDSVEKVISMTEEDFLKVPNVGKITASQIYLGVQDKSDLIRDLATVIKIVGPTMGVLSGKSFCITGSTSVPRKALQKRIIDAGGIAKDSVTSGLSYLVTNEDQSFGSAKMKKAASYGTQIITENELIRMIEASV